jgi:hypothetical protein
MKNLPEHRVVRKPSRRLPRLKPTYARPTRINIGMLTTLLLPQY